MNMKAKENAQPATFEGWAMLELMGHRIRWGYVTEVEVFGAKMARVDIHTTEKITGTEFYGGASIYGMTVTTEEACKRMNDRIQPAPYAALPPPKRLHVDDESPCSDDDCMRDHEDDEEG